MKPATIKTMQHQQDKNAFAYVIYEKRVRPSVNDGNDEWIRSLMFYAQDPAHSDRDATWEYNIGWRNPENIRVVPLFDDEGNDAKREANLDAIRAQYDADMAETASRNSLADAVEWALEAATPELDRFESLIRTLEAFDSMVTHQLTIPPHTVQRADWMPSAEELEDVEAARQLRHDLKE